MGVNGATDTFANANPPPRDPGTDSSKQVKEFQEALSSANETASPLGVAKEQLDYLILKGEQLDLSKLDPLKCFGPPPEPNGPQLRAATGNEKPYFEPKTLSNLFTLHLEDPGVAGNLTVCTGGCFGAGGSLGFQSGSQDRLTTGVGLLVDASLGASTDIGDALPKGTTVEAGLGLVSGSYNVNEKGWSAKATLGGLADISLSEKGWGVGIGPVEVNGDGIKFGRDVIPKAVVGAGVTISEESSKFFLDPSGK